MQTKKAETNAQSQVGTPAIAERELRDFCKQAGEELGTLLATILGELNYGLSTANAQVQSRAMAIAATAAERALQVSSSLRFLGALAPPVPRNTDVSQLLLHTVDALKGELELRGIRIRALATSSTTASTDPTILGHIITALLLNLGEAMKGGGEIQVSLKAESNFATLQIELHPSHELDHTHMQALPKKLPFRLATELLANQGGTLSFENPTTIVLHFPQDPSGEPVPTFIQKRRYPRVQVQLRGELQMSGGLSASVEIPILSEKGCYILFSKDGAPQRPLKINLLGSLKIFYFEGQAIDIESIRIASVDPKGHDRGIGVEFMKVDRKAENVLSALVRSHVG